MRSTSKGFTLIELLVVIAIIAILAAILFPVFIGAKQRASEVKCLSNLKQIGTAVGLYLSDNNDRYPFDKPVLSAAVPPDDINMPAGSGPGVPGLMRALERYTKNVNIWMCPTGAKRKPNYPKCSVPYGENPGLVFYTRMSSNQLVCSNYWCFPLNREFTGRPPAGQEGMYESACGGYIRKGDENCRGISPAVAMQLHGRTFSPGGLFHESWPNPKWNNRLIQDSYIPGDSEWRPHKGGTNILYHDGHAGFVRDFRKSAS